VNERIRAAKEGRTVWVGIAQWVCECTDENCTERIMMSLDEYEELRANPTHFAVVPDMRHVVPDAERIVEKHEHFWVVEKVGEAAEAAKELDVRYTTAPRVAPAPWFRGAPVGNPTVGSKL
jgi:hypothetical protein